MKQYSKVRVSVYVKICHPFYGSGFIGPTAVEKS